jgi:hypothetical protein
MPATSAPESPLLLRGAIARPDDPPLSAVNPPPGAPIGPVSLVEPGCSFSISRRTVQGG